MSSRPKAPQGNDRGTKDAIDATKHGVFERLSDPHLTDHDRWVLRQFGMFLSGVAPEPDPRALRTGDRGQPYRSRIGARHR